MFLEVRPPFRHTLRPPTVLPAPVYGAICICLRQHQRRFSAANPPPTPGQDRDTAHSHLAVAVAEAESVGARAEEAEWRVKQVLHPACPISTG